MRVLAFDCSAGALSVALVTGTGSAEACLDLGLRHAERLMELVDFCVSRAGLRPADIDLVACSGGPGSFTGLRIAMSTAKGMALALGKPRVTVPSLDALAWGLEWAPGAVMPVIDGKKGRLNAALYERGSRVSAWLDAPLAELAALLDTYPEALVTGPDASLFEGLAAERAGLRLDRRAGMPAARAIAALAVERFESHGPSPEDEGPLYLRPSEAEETDAARSGRATEEGPR